MNNIKDRQIITLQETLAYLKYINRQKPFNNETIQIPTKDYEQPLQQNRSKYSNQNDKSKKLKIQQDEDLSKKINKNRAIKRIIQGAFTILQEFNNYEDNQQDNNDKSSEIQFNIYLKQYNRVLQMIFQKEKERINKEDIKSEKRQEILQNIFEYIVVEDFREILPIAIVKDKINKNNVEIMINALSSKLVVLRQNQLRIYDSEDGLGSHKSIKLHEIENVDYHTQPYIFIVLTIQKDKERSNIYMKFQTQKNQEKWDRALYCCYIGRKMKTKEKFFLIEYPQEDVKKKEIQETKKIANFTYESFSKKNSIDVLLNEDNRSPSISQKRDKDKQNQDESTSKKISNTKSIIKNNSFRSKEDISENGFNRSNSENKSKGVFEKDNMVVIDGQNNISYSKNPSMELINRNKTDFINLDDQSGEANLSPNRTPRDMTTNNNMNFTMVSKQTMKDFSEPPNQKELLPQDIKEIHDLERKHIKGIILTKQKFFFNKQKIIYLKENHEMKQKSQKSHLDIKSQYEAMKLRYLEYWDFDEKKGEKEERKIIKLTSVKKCEIQEEKMLYIGYDSKEIVFSGDLEGMKEIFRWNQLIQNIYKSKLINYGDVSNLK